jgi:putative SOS response-associated peptidase YedK
LHRYAALFEAHPLQLSLPARYNVAPSMALVACRENSLGNRELVTLAWGFVPRWADRRRGPRPINARAETLFSKPLFRDAARLRRCLVPAEGFYEWRQEGEVKQPYFVRLKNDEPLALAAIWDTHVQEGEDAGSVAIVVTEPNTLVAPLHDRMPVIVAPQDYALWLDGKVHDPARLEALLRPYAADEMEAVPVSREINKAGAEGPWLLTPIG